NKMKKKIILLLYCIVVCHFLHAQKNTFKLCEDGKTYPYYSPELKYKGGLFAIQQTLSEKYESKKFANKKNNTGILTIQFQVNCKGESGNYRILATDFDYKKIVLNKKMTNRITLIIKNLDNWVPGRNEENNTVNSHK